MLFCGCILATTYVFTLHDPDYYWHIKAGEYILNNWSIPREDIFSYTMQGEKWVLHEWLFQVILYFIYSTFGEIWVKLFSVGTLFLSIFSIFSIAKKHSSARIAFLCILFFPILCFPFLAPRPQIFSYLFFTFYMYALLEKKYFHKETLLYFLPVVMIAWVNLHGGYVVGMALLLIYSATEFLTAWAKTGHVKQSFLTIKTITIITLATFIATGCNPDSFHHWIYPFQVMTMETSLDFITEWKSPDFHDNFGKVYLLFVFLFFLTGILKKKSSDFSETLLPIFFLFQAFLYNRHIPIALLATTPFLCRNLYLLTAQENIQEFKNRFKPIVSLLIRNKKNLTNNLGTKEFVLNWIFLSAIVILFFILGQTKPSHFYQTTIQTLIPEDAVSFIEDNHIKGRFFNSYNYGGYLIYRLFPKQKVFIDGRADMYGDEFVEKYIEIIGGGADWEENFDAYDINYIICENNAPLRQLVLTRGDFKLVFEDKYHSVLLKDNDTFQAIISEYEML